MRVSFLVVIVVIIATRVFSQCGSEPTLGPSVEVVTSKKITLDRPTEVSLTIVASASQTSWRQKDSEAAALTIFVDGIYDQDLLLFAGDGELSSGKMKGFDYEIFIGELSKGEHKIAIALNKQRSAQKIGTVTVSDIKVAQASLASKFAATTESNSLDSTQLQQQNADFIALSNAPFIYARPNAIDKFTDIPLVMYYEVLNEPGEVTRIRYTIIFTNEDGGTKSKALMARWGRMTDIEWVYEIRLDKQGSVVSQTYQATNHQTLDFKGKRMFGSHPLMYTATDNNNFSDNGCSALRFGLEPKRADLRAASRETVMEKFPWVYRVMADEMFREGRVAANSNQENVVDDPREYIYAEVYNEPQSSALDFEVLTTDGRKFSSDLESAALRVDRPGYIRIALHLPPD